MLEPLQPPRKIHHIQPRLEIIGGGVDNNEVLHAGSGSSGVAISAHTVCPELKVSGKVSIKKNIKSYNIFDYEFIFGNNYTHLGVLPKVEYNLTFSKPNLLSKDNIRLWQYL